MLVLVLVLVLVLLPVPGPPHAADAGVVEGSLSQLLPPPPPY